MSTKNDIRRETDELAEQFDFSRTRHGKEALQARHDRRLEAAKKDRITIRIDQDVLNAFRQLAGEGAYQSLINQALRDWLTAQSVKELLREELPRLLAAHHSGLTG